MCPTPPGLGGVALPCHHDKQRASWRRLPQLRQRGIQCRQGSRLLGLPVVLRLLPGRLRAAALPLPAIWAAVLSIGCSSLLLLLLLLCTPLQLWCI